MRAAITLDVARIVLVPTADDSTTGASVGSGDTTTGITHSGRSSGTCRRSRGTGAGVGVADTDVHRPTGC
jgi:hypothetical protein